jgi:LmbE family N-acetylglucosaminyl deacetylase
MSTRANGIPRSAMAIVAHPDDTEFSMAGTAALWSRAGCRFVYVICTDGNAGSHDPEMTAERLIEIRRAEQRAACALLGIEEVVFLGYGDGQLQPTLELRRELVRLIRLYRPEVLFCNDPTVFFTPTYINHPDHRAAGQAALEAVFPACEMRLLWPEAGPPHEVPCVYILNGNPANEWVDITSTIDVKVQALQQHWSQVGSWDVEARIRQRSAEIGEEKGFAYAERFRVITRG